MQQFEEDYANLVKEALAEGEKRQTRNGETTSAFGKMLKVPMNGKTQFPILQGRRMFHQGVFGEFAAMVRKPTCLADFEAWGCNYWKLWAKEDGSINVDYGNAWHADGQIERLKDTLKNNPTDRRMIINGWRPANIDNLDLPCCHLLYQFYVRDGKYLDIMWYQRSVDLMIGLPSDIVFAAVWIISLANEVGLVPGEITMMLGDCHVYAEHYQAAHKYIDKVYAQPITKAPTYKLTAKPGKDFCLFEPKDILLNVYTTHSKLDLELKA